MKQLVLSAISLYQHYIAVILKMLLGYSSTCRYPVTCSEYAKIAIEKHGVLMGSYRSVARLLTCQPFSRGGLA